MANEDKEEESDDSDCDKAPCYDTVVVRGKAKPAGGSRRRSKRERILASGE